MITTGMGKLTFYRKDPVLTGLREGMLIEALKVG